MNKVKAIQSYIPFNNTVSPAVALGKEYTYLTLLSCLQLNKLFGEVTLYTNKKIGDYFTDLGFPYTIDTSLDKEEGHYFAMPKLKSFMLQKKPFFHFDLDTLVFDKPALFEKTSPYLFSHRDMPNRGYSKKDRSFPKSKHKAVNAMIQDKWFHNLMESYLLPYYSCDWLPEGYPAHLIDPNNIPNMNLIGVKDVSKFKKATSLAIEIAEANKKIFTNNWLASNFIEQLTIPLYLELTDKKYAKALKEKKAIDSVFTFNGDPFTCDGFPKDEDKWKTEIPKFPFNFIHHYQCTECTDWHKKEILISDKSDLIKNLDLSKFKYVHIGGGNKQYALWQAMIIHTIIENYGSELLLNITEFYRKNDQDNNLRLKFSPGELLYEELTGHKLFTETYLNKLKLSLL